MNEPTKWTNKQTTTKQQKKSRNKPGRSGPVEMQSVYSAPNVKKILRQL